MVSNSELFNIEITKVVSNRELLNIKFIKVVGNSDLLKIKMIKVVSNSELLNVKIIKVRSRSGSRDFWRDGHTFEMTGLWHPILGTTGEGEGGGVAGIRHPHPLFWIRQ